MQSRDHYALVAHWATSGTAWSWLEAALAKTDRIVLDTGVIAPILRYNPVALAQVFLLRLHTCSLAESFLDLGEVSH